jgi:hypothetical protein
MSTFLAILGLINGIGAIGMLLLPIVVLLLMLALFVFVHLIRLSKRGSRAVVQFFGLPK